jgi:ethanolamine ammonia-lyase small subunit
VDPLWDRFGRVTRARIGLGRAGDALPTRHSLDFQYAHACARDAVGARVDFDALVRQLEPRPAIKVCSAAPDRPTYLRRPDLGRRLSPDTAGRLPRGPYDAVFVIADGLSARAVERNALPVLMGTMARLIDWSFGPVILAEQARVALGDDIGARMHAATVVMLIGERPGLSVPDSLGVYLTFAPRIGRSDAERNCISNIHADGLTHDAAAAKLAWLMSAARSRCLTGVALKEDEGRSLPGLPPTDVR